MTRMFIVAMISAVVSAPFSLIVQYIVMNVLSKESAVEDEDEEAEKSAKVRRSIAKISPDGSGASSCLVESCGGSSDEDMRNLLRELCEYYKGLVAEEKKRRDEGQGSDSSSCVMSATEFRGQCLLLCFVSPSTFPVRRLGLTRE